MAALASSPALQEVGQVVVALHVIGINPQGLEVAGRRRRFGAPVQEVAQVHHGVGMIGPGGQDGLIFRASSSRPASSSSRAR